MNEIQKKYWNQLNAQQIKAKEKADNEFFGKIGRILSHLKSNVVDYKDPLYDLELH